MVVEAKRKEELKPKVDVSKIVKTSFDFTIEEVLPVEEPIETKKEVKTVVSYIPDSYYKKLAELDSKLSNSYDMSRNFEQLTEKELLIFIDKAVTKKPELFYDIKKLCDYLNEECGIGVYEFDRDIQEYLDIINQRDIELMEG